MHINDEKNMFMCFACQTGGDAITFVSKFKNIDFKGALEELAGILGVDYQDYARERVASPKEEMAKKILSKSSQIFKKIAIENNPAPYLEFIKNRNINKNTIDEFCIGFAPNSNILSNYLDSIPNENEKKMAINIALEIGILKKDLKRENAYYDTFRDRIMFPIWDQYGNVKGFGGRAIHDYQKAKYLNSGESFTFNKKNILYGLNLAKHSIRDRDYVILVEGYMDVIGPFQNGFKNTVAVMGVGLSEYAVNALKGLTKNIYMALDSDQAGMNAMKRVNELFMKQNILPKIVDLSPHKDPDEFINSLGALAFQERIDKAQTYIDFEIQSLLPESIPETSDQKLEILQKIFKLISPLRENLLATERIISFARRIGLKSTEEQILRNYTNYLNSNSKYNTFTSNHSISDESNFSDLDSKNEINLNISEQIPEKLDQIYELTKYEKVMIKEIVQHPEILTHPKLKEILDHSSHNGVKNYILELKEIYFEIDDLEYFSIVSEKTNSMNVDLRVKEVAGAALFNYRPEKLEESVVDKFLTDLDGKLLKEKLKMQKDALKIKQKNCQTKDELNNILSELHKIDKELFKIKKQNQINS